MLIISNRLLTAQLEIKIDGEIIDVASEIKHLGLRLRFSSSIDDLINKMASKIGDLTRLRNYINLAGKIELYNTLIGSYINFCRTKLFLSCRIELPRLQKIQNRGMRAVLNCGSFTTSVIMLNIFQ